MTHGNVTRLRKINNSNNNHQQSAEIKKFISRQFYRECTKMKGTGGGGPKFLSRIVPNSLLSTVLPLRFLMLSMLTFRNFPDF